MFNYIHSCLPNITLNFHWIAQENFYPSVFCFLVYHKEIKIQVLNFLNSQKRISKQRHLECSRLLLTESQECLFIWWTCLWGLHLLSYQLYMWFSIFKIAGDGFSAESHDYIQKLGGRGSEQSSCSSERWKVAADSATVHPLPPLDFT